MGRTRQDLQKILETLLGSRNVYYQPPENLKLKYPCIIFSRGRSDIFRADNRAYVTTKRYDIIVINTKTDSTISDKLVAELPMCTYNRSYNQNNLYYEALTLYF